jgi:hypothetical protein
VHSIRCATYWIMFFRHEQVSFFESDMKIKKWNLGIIFELWNNDVRFNSCIRLRKSRIFLMYKLIGWRISQWFHMVWRDSIFLTCFLFYHFERSFAQRKKSQSVSNKHVGLAGILETNSAMNCIYVWKL